MKKEITMSISQYKQYKNGEINLLNIKLQNIGLNRNYTLNKTILDTTTYFIENKRLILTLVIIATGFIGSELALTNLSVNALDFKPELCQSLFSQNNSRVYGI